MLVLSPSTKGHFKNYFEVINKYEPSEFKVLHLTSFFDIHFIRQVLRNKKILFLHGEIQIKLLLLFIVIFPFKPKSVIFYYSFFKKNKTYNLLYQLLRYLKVKCWALEASCSDLRCGLQILNDPVLGGKVNSLKLTTSKPLCFLIAGYIDDRKSVKEIITALTKIVKQGVQIQLNIIGTQSDSVKYFLKHTLEVHSFIITVRDKRISDDELNMYISNSDCILSIYQRHAGSSGFVIKSIASRIPILFIPKDALLKFEKLINFKHLPKTPSVEEIYKSITEYLAYSGPFYNENECEFFDSNHTEDFFARNILDDNK